MSDSKSIIRSKNYVKYKIQQNHCMFFSLNDLFCYIGFSNKKIRRKKKITHSVAGYLYLTYR